MNLNHNYIGTEHLLLAMTVDDLDVASRVLAECGITEMGLKSQVVHELEAARERLTESDAETLAALGIDLDEVQRRVEETFGAFALDTPPLRLSSFTGPNRRRLDPESAVRNRKAAVELGGRSGRTRDAIGASNQILAFCAR